MKTVEEAVEALDFQRGSAHSVDLTELYREARLLWLALAICDSQNEGDCYKLLRALCMGVIIGRETQR